MESRSGEDHTAHQRTHANVLLVDPSGQSERAKLYKKMQEIVQEDAPWVFVANWKQNAVTSDKVNNFSLQPSFFLILKDVTK